jgi:hypothetical protein
MGFNKKNVINHNNFNKNLSNDYRDIYLGDYLCHSSTTVISIDKQPSIREGSLTIKISKDPVDSILQISFGSQILRFKLKTPSLISYPEGRRYGGRFYLTDSIGLDITLGRLTSIRLNGKKI